MRLTNYTDYSLRVLIYLAAQEPSKLSNIKEIAETYGISKNHLMKVTHELGKMGVVETIRGRNGGIKLALAPKEINVGAIVRKTEDDFRLVECFDGNAESCLITPVCGLRHALNKALMAYLNVLDQYTLADLIKNPIAYRELFQMGK
ncbi:Rrf2 family transcriptional regulator [Heyndrickxia acidicola]|jgi:Rrf2 family nitric oxide-sensitive transcriptional repressor|uniref:HTH-type transcriptional regulator NsrR n=1 Tax=Heyndrickxia acidicola TaxID=209389 RepID=A0ABU6ME09_9BACI|nr:Rrf2 family transcriptional regulator [Heyndrickxia acidicola]MED1202266.1 Rrf2 family transcriptional regulator [Heyndrickxia acidicola]